MPFRVEPMTFRQLLLRDGVGGPAPALSARGSVSMPGG